MSLLTLRLIRMMCLILGLGLCLLPALAEKAFAQALADGHAYFNIHTSFAAGGEIRGFLAPVPEPATSGLVLLGIAGLGAARIYRRKRD